MEPKALIAATKEVDLPDSLTSDVAPCQPVGTLLVQPVCFEDEVEPQQQRETMIKPRTQEQIAGTTLQATISGHDWLTLSIHTRATMILLTS